MRKLVTIFLIILVVIGATSCRVFIPSKMIRTGWKYKYSEFSKIKTKADSVYVLAIDDKLSFQVFTNDGEKLINPLSAGSNGVAQNNNQGNRNGSGSEYIIEYDGMVKFPVFGRIEMSGLTLREAEIMLEKRYSESYNKPFVRIQVLNKRVYFFSGEQASVLPLETTTTLFQALAFAGGIGDSKAHRIKLIRGDMKNPDIYLIDFSTIDGLRQTNIILQANDIIYLEERNRVPQRIIESVSPYLALFSTIAVVLSLVNR